MVNETAVAVTHNEERLAKLGFTMVAVKLKTMKQKKVKLALAYEHFRFVRQENIDKFNEQLKKKTLKGEGSWNQSWQKLDFMDVSQYQHAPPANVLDSLEKAQAMEAKGVKVFDRFEVAYIRDVKDPIIFGRIEGCTDRFFIDQWDDDVKISDLLKDNEG